MHKVIETEREEYIQRLVAAARAMDDRALVLHVRQCENAARKHPRTGDIAELPRAQVVPFRRAATQ